MPLHDTHYSFAKLLAEAGYVKIVPHSYNADTKHVSVDFPGTDDEYKAACAAVRPPKSEPATTTQKEDIKMGFSYSDIIGLIDAARAQGCIVPTVSTMATAPTIKTVEKIVEKEVVPADYEQLKVDLEAARKTAATWQSKYTTLFNEFEAYKASHSAVVNAPAVPVTAECPFEDSHDKSEVLYSLVTPAAPATKAITKTLDVHGKMVTVTDPDGLIFTKATDVIKFDGHIEAKPIPEKKIPSTQVKFPLTRQKPLDILFSSIKNEYLTPKGKENDRYRSFVAAQYLNYKHGPKFLANVEKEFAEHSWWSVDGFIYAIENVIFPNIDAIINTGEEDGSLVDDDLYANIKVAYPILVKMHNDRVDAEAATAPATSATATAPESSAFSFDSFEVE